MIRALRSPGKLNMVGACLLLMQPVIAEDIPKTPWGVPDLQGVWTNATSTPLERPDEYANTEVLSEAQRGQLGEAVLEKYGQGGREAWFDLGLKALSNGQMSLIIHPKNGKIPWKTDSKKTTSLSGKSYFPWETTAPGAPFRSYRDLDTGERCITDGVGIYPQHPYNNNFQIFQTDLYIVIMQEMYHEYRIIPLDGRPHLDPPVGQWLGDARGYWEGDTLIIESQGYMDTEGWHWAVPWRAAKPTLKLTERLTRTDEFTIDYFFTMEDSTRFSEPWTARIPLTNNHAERGVTGGDLYEFACHEGNYSIPNMLSMPPESHLN